MAATLIRRGDVGVGKGDEVSPPLYSSNQVRIWGHNSFKEGRNCNDPLEGLEFIEKYLIFYLIFGLKEFRQINS